LRSRFARWTEPDERRSVSGPALVALVIVGSLVFLSLLVIAFGDVPLE
jgi:hypothetical protein